MMDKPSRILYIIAGILNWGISLMAAFGSENGWLQAGQFFFGGSFFVLLGMQSPNEPHSYYRILRLASIAISLIFGVLHLIN